MHQYHSFKYNWAKCSLKKFWRKFAFIVCKHKNKGLILQKNLHRWQKYYTTASRDKFWLCTIVLVLNNIIYLEEDFSWSGLGLAGPSPWVRNLHALAFHWIPITAPEKDKILKYLDMKGILGAVILSWSPEGSVATSRAARRGRDTRPALVDHLEEFGGNTLTYMGNIIVH